MDTNSDNHFNNGIDAYKGGDLRGAIQAFKSELNANPSNWHARFYLAMSYARDGQQLDARREFMTIRDTSTDAELRQKASAALSAMSKAPAK